MNSKNPFIKLMIIGRVNTKLKDLIKKKQLNEVDIKLLKGIFLRNAERKIPKKGLFETFNCKFSESTKVKSKILRRFESFVLKDTVEDEEPNALLDSIEQFDKLKNLIPLQVTSSIHQSTRPFKVATTKPRQHTKVSALYDHEHEETGDDTILQEYNEIKTKASH